jgi:ferredoxin
MKIHVDRNLCEANGLCLDACAAVFRLTDEDELIVDQTKVTDALRAELEEAVRVCPRCALCLED